MSILSREKIILNASASDKFDAIRQAGQLLVQAGHVPPEYVGYMIERERTSSTYLGGGLAMPHGTNEAKGLIRSTGMSILVMAGEGVDFGGDEPARLVIGLAAVGDEHMEVLASVAGLVTDDEQMQRVYGARTEEELLRVFEEGMAE